MTAPRKNAPKTRGRPFKAGNPGRPKGSRHKATLAAEALLDGEAEKLTRKAIEMALAGDAVALRMCLERILPPRRSRPVVFDVVELKTADDVLVALAALVRTVCEGLLTPDEGAAVANLIEVQRKGIETQELESRLRILEERVNCDV